MLFDKTNRDMVIEVLAEAARKLYFQAHGYEVIDEGLGFGDATVDTEIRADRALGTLMRDLILREGNPARISVEGLEDTRSPGHDWWAVDPLDGSLNFRVKVTHWGGLPYTSCITVLKKADDAKFGDIEVVAVANLRSAPNLDCVIAWLDPEAECECRRIEVRHHRSALDFRVNPVKHLDLGSQIVIGEMYYPENRELLARMFAGKKGWLRNPGSAAYEMTLVATGQAVAYICDRQKQHELGAGYLLVKGAGGVAVDFDGKDLGPREYDFKTQTPVILAANQAIADQVLELMAKAK